MQQLKRHVADRVRWKAPDSLLFRALGLSRLVLGLAVVGGVMVLLMQRLG